MTDLFSAEYVLFWTALMGLALFFPIRRLLWILTVRRAERDGNEDHRRRLVLRKRAGITAALLSVAFSYFYIAWLFKS